jgi:hypothetical protein
MKKILVLIIVFGFLLSACEGANLRTMQRQQAGRVDPISINDSEKYDRDFNECAKYAADWLTRAQIEASARAWVGALVGAGVGAATGYAFGGHHGARHVAGLGATYGGLDGVASTPVYSNQVFGNCMLNRGYALLW